MTNDENIKPQEQSNEHSDILEVLEESLECVQLLLQSETSDHESIHSVTESEILILILLHYYKENNKVVRLMVQWVKIILKVCSISGSIKL